MKIRTATKTRLFFTSRPTNRFDFTLMGCQVLVSKLKIWWVSNIIFRLFQENKLSYPGNQIVYDTWQRYKNKSKIEISFNKKKSNRLVENNENLHLHTCINGYKLKRIFSQNRKKNTFSPNNRFIFYFKQRNLRTYMSCTRRVFYVLLL